MKKAIVLSIPFSGTHSVTWTLSEVFGVDVRFQHFMPDTEDNLREILNNLPATFPVIIPLRDSVATWETWCRKGHRQNKYEECVAVLERLLPMLERMNVVYHKVDVEIPAQRYMALGRLERVFRIDIPEDRMWDIAKAWPKLRTGDYALHDKVLHPWRRSMTWILGDDNVRSDENAARFNSRRLDRILSHPFET